MTKKPAGKATPSAPKKKPETTYKLLEGDKAPKFSVPSTSGKNVDEASLRGSGLTAIYFYPKDDTSGCTLEGNEFSGLYKQFKAAKTEVYGASCDSIKSHEKFRTKYDYPFHLLSDESKKLVAAFDVLQTKSMYGKTYLGIERSTFLIGPDGHVVKAWRKVKAPGHAAEVLAAAKAFKKA